MTELPDPEPGQKKDPRWFEWYYGGGNPSDTRQQRINALTAEVAALKAQVAQMRAFDVYLEAKNNELHAENTSLREHLKKAMR